MNRHRVIPTLTIDKERLVKTVRFEKPQYIGDPVNAVKIFNEKEVDEVILLDITAGKQKREPNYQKIEEICSEAFMPFAYGGGINDLSQIKKLFQLGIEKVILNSTLADNLELVKQASDIFGSQSIVASVDVGKNFFGKYQVYVNSGQKKVKLSLESYLDEVLNSGIGELFINAIHKDGTYTDYDFNLIKLVANMSDVPVVACGGAKDLESFRKAIEHGATAVSAGSLFVYRGASKGILINYPSQKELAEQVFNKK